MPMSPKLVLGMCLGSLALTLFLAALDIVIVITLYDVISEKFNAYGEIGWLVTGYSLPNALFTLLWGRLSALYGLKTCLSASIIIFEIGSLVVALSYSMSMLIGGRVIAGIGGSGIQSLVFVVGTSLVEERNRGLVITVLGLAFMVSNAVGPVLGGAFSQHVSWRWCFYINLPIGGLAYAMLQGFYNPAQKSFRNTITEQAYAVKNYRYSNMLTAKFWGFIVRFFIFKLDFIGFALSSAGFVLVLLGLTFGGEKYSWSSGTIIAYLTVGLVLLILWLLYDFIILPYWGKFLPENERAEPLLPWASVKIIGALSGTISNFFVSFGLNMAMIYLIQFYQLVRHESATASSMHMWGILVPAIVCIVVQGNIVKKFGVIKPIAVGGVALGTIGAGLLTMQNGSTPLGHSIGYSILPGVGFATVMQSTMLSAQIQVEKTDPDFRQKFIELTALNTFGKAMGMAFGGIVATLIFSTTVKDRLKHADFPVPHFDSSAEIVAYRETHYDGPESPMAKVLTKGVQNVFYVALGCYALSFLFTLLMSNKRLVLAPKSDSQHSTKDIEHEATTIEDSKLEKRDVDIAFLDPHSSGVDSQPPIEQPHRGA
ncbi:LAFA_0F02872g1_1 [Lachancea sp. 'fantastica']|nr:LAFA_0F02872g1_1 [Lachancea sp. 'fantastica']